MMYRLEIQKKKYMKKNMNMNNKIGMNESLLSSYSTAKSPKHMLRAALAPHEIL